MDSSRENCKRSCPKHAQILEQHSYDRLSNLPIDILHHILSFLDITEVVNTSFLSRKWQYIWTSIPRLYFDFRGSSMWRLDLSYDECLSNFWEFFKWTLIMRDASPIHMLQLLCDSFDGKQLKPLLSLCAMSNVKELHLLSGYDEQDCPSSHTFLEPDLTIRQNVIWLVNLQSFTVFGNLMTLHLVRVRFPENDITRELFSNCGILESLSLVYCCFKMTEVLEISAHKLKKLNIVNLGRDNIWESDCLLNDGLKVHAPNLVSFWYEGPILPVCEFSDMPFFNDAWIQAEFESHPGQPVPLLGEMVSSIRRAKELSSSAAFALYFSAPFGGSPRKVQFDYLKFLKLKMVCDADHMEGLIKLLKLSPNLEVLRIKYIERPRTGSWKSREANVACLSNHLKEIEFKRFKDSPYASEVIKFFLQNTKSLENLKIVQKTRKPKPKKIYALPSVQLASEAVSVSIVSKSLFETIELHQFVYGKSESVFAKSLGD